MNDTVLARLLRYVVIDTQSVEEATTYPSTQKQFDLLNLLVKELKELGVANAKIDKYGYVTGTIPANLPKSDKAFGRVPSIGLIAHVDTSPEVSGTNVKPQVIKEYRGGDIVLPGDQKVVIRTSENPQLSANIGKTIVTTDGHNAAWGRRQSWFGNYYDGRTNTDEKWNNPPRRCQVGIYTG